MTSPRRRREKHPLESELRFHSAFPSKYLGYTRPLVVYLPPGYREDTKRRYPVIYLHDGQNLFEPALAAFGVAWDAGGIADRLIAAGRLTPLLMVGIYNTPERLDEYAVDYDFAHRQGGKGRFYGRFVMEEVKPFIDEHYRTLPDREATAVIGSSMGGLVSLTMARDHGRQFSMCGALSPSLWWGKGQMLQTLDDDRSWLRGMRFWIDMGTHEGRRQTAVPPLIQRTRALVG